MSPPPREPEKDTRYPVRVHEGDQSMPAVPNLLRTGWQYWDGRRWYDLNKRLNRPTYMAVAAAGLLGAVVGWALACLMLKGGL